MGHKIQKISGPLRGRITYEERKNEMATEFLNDARKEIERRTEDFYGELKAFYQGNGEAEQNLMEQTTQPFWQSLRLSRKRLQQRELTVDMEMQEPARLADYDGPWKDGYDYSCRRTQPVKMRRTYYRKGKKIAFLKTPEIAAASFLKADVQGDMVICPNCGHEGKLTSYIDGCDACGAKFLVSDFETKVSGFSLEEDARQKSISNFMKAGAVVGITAISLAVLAICAGGIMFLLLALGRNGYNAVKAAAAMMLGIGLAPVFFTVVVLHAHYIYCNVDRDGDSQKAENSRRIESKGRNPGILHG